jgi:TonB family protein
MTATDHKALVPAVPASLTARIDERLIAPLRRNPQATRRFAATVAFVLLLHGALIAAFLLRDRKTPAQVADREPQAVDIVVEPPKPPPKPPTPKAPPKPELEKPAFSAPRAPSDEKIDTTQLQKETHAPTAPRPPTDGQPQPSKEAASPADEMEKTRANEEASAKPDVLKKDAEALDKARDRPKDKPKKVAKAVRAKARRPLAALQQLAGASPLPDYSFARPTKKSPVTGGTEDSRYLAIVYGMIMQHRSMIDAPADEGGSVTIAFTVDDEGNVIGMGIEQTSGYPQVDAEAAAAIRRASPFPPPPAGAPHGLIATIDFADGDPAYAMGSRAR